MAGGTHGSIDAAHVLVDCQAVAMLRFGGVPGATATIDDDRSALERLAPQAP
jgi:hypothetical protein